MFNLFKKKKKMDKLNYDDVFNLIYAVGSSLNCNLGKPIKGRFVESVICKTIENSDHIDEEYDILVSGSHRVEVKSLKHCLFTEKGNPKKNKTSKITLKNVRGEGDYDYHYICSKFDELYIVDTGNDLSYSIAKIDSEDLLNPDIANWDSTKDGFQCQIKIEYLNFLCKPDDITIDKDNIEQYDTGAAQIVTDITLNLLKKDLKYVNVNEVCRHILRNWRIPLRNKKSNARGRVCSVR